MNVLKWATTAQIGERVIYGHRPVFGHPSDEVAVAMRTAMMAHNDGLVFLAQRRLDGTLYYEATRISALCAEKLGLNKFVGPALSYVSVR